MDGKFRRTGMLMGEDALEKLARCRVAVFGIGGVGGFVVEGLARAGVGALDLIDHDVVSESNINRQIVALTSTVGLPKTEVAAERVRDINPSCRVVIHNLFYLPDTADQIDLSVYDYVVDCVDTVTAKKLLIVNAKSAGVPVISSMGTGNKLDPTMLKVADIYDTKVCPLAKVMRRELKGLGLDKLKVVYSDEEPKVPAERVREQGRDVPGSCSFVPSVAGLIIAGEVVKDLAGV